MCTPTSDGDGNDSQHLTDFWKNLSSNSHIEQHRLRCTLGDTTGEISINNKNGITFESSGSGDHRSNVQTSHSLQSIKDSLAELRSQTRSTQRLQWLTMVLFIILSINVIYILKIEIKNSSPEYCLRN